MSDSYNRLYESIIEHIKGKYRDTLNVPVYVLSRHDQFGDQARYLLGISKYKPDMQSDLYQDYKIFTYELTTSRIKLARVREEQIREESKEEQIKEVSKEEQIKEVSKEVSKEESKEVSKSLDTLDVTEDPMLTKVKQLNPNVKSIKDTYTFIDRNTKTTKVLSIEDVIEIPLLVSMMEYDNFDNIEMYHVAELDWMLQLVINYTLPEYRFISKEERTKTYEVLRYFGIDVEIINRIAEYETFKFNVYDNKINLRRGIHTYIQSYEIINYAIIQYPELIFSYRFVDEAMCRKVVKYHGYFIRYIYKHWPMYVDENMCIDAIRGDVLNTRYIKPEHKLYNYEEFLMQTMRSRARYVEYIDKPSERLCLYFISHGTSIEKLNYQNRRICEAAFARNINEFRYCHYQSENMCMRMINIDIANLRYVRYPTPKIMNYVLEKDPSVLIYYIFNDEIRKKYIDKAIKLTSDVVELNRLINEKNRLLELDESLDES